MAQRTGSKTLKAQPTVEPARPIATAGTMERRPRRDFVDTVWALFCSVRFAVVLNAAGALAVMTGTVIPQMQPGTQNFQDALDTFLTGARNRYGDLTVPLYWAGVVSVLP